MLDMLKGESKFTRRRPIRAAAGFLLALPLLAALASVSHAVAPSCTDCHGVSGPHPVQCGEISCGVSLGCHPHKLDTIAHPSGTGTPLSDISSDAGVTAACNTCHRLPAPNPTHPFGIKTDPTSSAPYPDTTMVCGPCHGDAGTAHKFTGFAPNLLNTFAAGMHIRSNPGTTCSVCHASVTSSHLTNSVAHAVTHTDNATCTTCHIRAGVRPASATMAACAGCHTQTLATMNHPHGNPGTPTSCADCHPAPGVVPQTAAGICDRCHFVDETAGLPQIHYSSSNPNPVGSYGTLSDGRLLGGQVSVRDALRALKIGVGLINPTANDLAHGDVAPLVNGKPQPDGKIDVEDALVILRRGVGLISW
ncbi:MAG TPA: hypothetical protein VLG39_00360 [Nitrospirota bacterium]|nr:hypothetical protein [Nitrospirota bacterium]